jgi:nitrate reductase cytochrome c-type subunit
VALLRLNQRAGLAGTLILGLVSLAWASDDWDWGAVEAMDDAPMTRPAPPTPPTPPVSPAEQAAQQAAHDKMRRDAARAAADFERDKVVALEIFPDAPPAGPISVVQARRDRDMHPCANCHQWVTSNPEARKLSKPHDNFELQHGMHGKGGFWCLTCHDAKNNMTLKTFEGEPVGFEHAYVVCTQCHVQQGRDWMHGAHGKRVGNWNGPREVLNCTACHYQHRPAIEPRGPMPGPSIRTGLPRPEHWVSASEREDHHAEHAPVWQRDADRRRESVPESVPGTAATDSSEVSDAES